MRHVGARCRAEKPHMTHMKVGAHNKQCAAHMGNLARAIRKAELRDPSRTLDTTMYHQGLKAQRVSPVTLSICDEPKWYAGTRSAPAWMATLTKPLRCMINTRSCCCVAPWKMPATPCTRFGLRCYIF